MTVLDESREMQKRLPGLSVGIPVYNQVSTIEDTIESLLCQSVPPLEIVISENHSNDGTQDIVERYAGRVRIVRPHRHLGMTENWNFLVGHMRGEWFSLLSGDDVALPRYVETFLRGAGRSALAVLVRAGWRNVDGNGNVRVTNLLLSVPKRVGQPFTLYESLTGPKSSFAAFAANWIAWRRVGGFPERLRLFSDWGLWVRLASEGEFIAEREIVSLYRTEYRPGLKERRLISELHDCIYLYNELIPLMAMATPRVDLRRVERARRYYFRALVSNTSQSVDNESRSAAVCALAQLARTDSEVALVSRLENCEIIPFFSWYNFFRTNLFFVRTIIAHIILASNRFRNIFSRTL
jgi:glycosyltransferase involved in cell wall biosynthesis